ncbi:PLDc N-terminal domain-containing protein [Desulfobaculum bizertense]|uniref:Phospholipase_D-nuclease N-terminal n=1 Tax=Desulfobaculum bizertense DSM 18034 TaxID=1121442 RepID=A0A1T4W2B6_9BACT|nr:PLDc N-terminal domain-containing protein [Desulfobaculum bizertense]UIJ38852.1 PLDc N-terminal domain-containing protein [Desulfobaculum bizertense]SKA71410.1 Phospholipase_D-nuclease N-terminal [Desulfobaculum bizertense DSM 18034]
MLVDLSSFSPALLATIGAIVLIAVLLSFWAIWHAFWRQFPSQQEKMIWLAVAVFIPFIGGIIYLLFGKNRGRRLES